jgi:hypothetical protein
MSLNHSPSIVTNGLVLYTDMSNTQKSWKGAPTVNLVSSPLNLASGRNSPSSCGSSFTDFTTGGPTDGPFVRVTRVTATAPADWPWDLTYTSIPVATTFKFSCYARSTNGTVSTIEFANPDAEEVSFVLTPQWQRYSTTFTSGVQGGIQFMRINRSNANDKTVGSIYDVANAQIEVQPIVTPFVNGTRSTTQAVVDLTNNNTLTATSLAYASDNTFSFNGNASGNYIDCGNAPALQIAGTITIDAWVKPTAYTNLGNIVAKNGNSAYRFRLDSTAGGLWWYVSGNAIQGGSAPLNTWSYLTVSGDSSGLYAYINGVLVASNATAYAPAAVAGGNVIIGALSAGSETFIGQISNVKIYNRRLSAVEVSQNFQALRGRYGI